MLHAEIFRDPRFLQLGRIPRIGWAAQFLFPAIQCLADDQGRLPGDPHYCKAEVCGGVPRLSVSRIESGLLAIDSVGLGILYTPDNEAVDLSSNTDRVLQLVDWVDWNPLRHREPSEWAPPTGWLDTLPDAPIEPVADPEEGGHRPAIVTQILNGVAEALAENQRHPQKPLLSSQRAASREASAVAQWLGQGMDAEWLERKLRQFCKGSRLPVHTLRFFARPLAEDWSKERAKSA